MGRRRSRLRARRVMSMRSIGIAFFLALATTVAALPPPLPHIARVTPSSGSIAGGDAVLISIENVDLRFTKGVTVLVDLTSVFNTPVVDDLCVRAFIRNRRGCSL